MRKSASQNYEQTTTWNDKDLPVGSTLEGVYKRKEEFTTELGESVKYVIAGKDGTLYGVYGSASINRQFSNIPEGSYVWLEYTGLTTSKKGRTVKTYNIDFDDEYQQ